MILKVAEDTLPMPVPLHSSTSGFAVVPQQSFRRLARLHRFRVSFMVQWLMREPGSFPQDLLGKSNDQDGDWTTRPEVAEVFDQVIEVLKSGLEPKSA